MAKCYDCKKEMTKSKSCSNKFRCIKIDGKAYPRNTTEFDYNTNCHDCGIENKTGNIHHFGCDMETCPKCKGQLISCNCRKEAIGVNEKWKILYLPKIMDIWCLSCVGIIKT